MICRRLCPQRVFSMLCISDLCEGRPTQLLVSDSPQRALVLHCKAANASMLKPCPDCWVTQTGPDGGDLGDLFCGKHLHRRKRAVAVRHFEELQQLPPGRSVASRRSTELGVNALSNDAPSPLYEIMTVGEPCRVATADILHVDGQVRRL